jgi:hypothetical protein
MRLNFHFFIRVEIQDSRNSLFEKNKNGVALDEQILEDSVLQTLYLSPEFFVVTRGAYVEDVLSKLYHVNAAFINHLLRLGNACQKSLLYDYLKFSILFLKIL